MTVKFSDIQELSGDIMHVDFYVNDSFAGNIVRRGDWWTLESIPGKPELIPKGNLLERAKLDEIKRAIAGILMPLNCLPIITA